MKRIMVLSVILTIMFSACNNSERGGSIMPVGVELHEGDVVFRRGSGLTSRVVIGVDSQGAYSHVGIVVDSAGTKMIVHAVPDEHDYEGDIDRVKMDKPEVFFSDVRALCGEVLRHIDAEAGRKAASEAVALYRRRIPFVHDYDDSDTTRMYCTELVTYAYRKAGSPLRGIQHHELVFLSLETNCVLPSDILGCKDLQKIIKF
jgi:hypothetical protein